MSIPLPPEGDSLLDTIIMKILITGGCGFIGSHLADRLLARGDSVVVVDNLSTGFEANLPLHKQLQVIKWSISDTAWVSLMMGNKQPDVVVHAAASYKDPNNWQEDIMTNVLGTANIVKACQENKVERLIYFNTALCYGLHPQTLPTPVNHPLLAEGTSYAITKTTGEKLIAMSGLDWVSFRLATAIGPRNISGPVPTFYYRLRDKKAVFVTDTKREFIFVDDLVDLVLLAIDGKGHGAYNASRGQDYFIKDVLAAVCQAMGLDVPEVEVRPKGADDAYTILLDPSKTNKDFGWEATTTMEQAIAEAVKWYGEHDTRETYTHLKMEDKK